MAPHSSALAWQIPWAEGPGGLQSMGSLGVDNKGQAQESVYRHIVTVERDKLLRLHRRCTASFSRFCMTWPSSYQPVGEVSLDKSIFNSYCLEDSLLESCIVYIFIDQ